jgi:hypothetical protein
MPGDDEGQPPKELANVEKTVTNHTTTTTTEVDSTSHATGRQCSAPPDDTESRAGVAGLTELERAPYDDPATYADVH